MRKCIHASLSVAAGAMLAAATAASAQVAPNPLFPYPGQCRSGQIGSACATIPAPPLFTPLPFLGQPTFAYELPAPVSQTPGVAGKCSIDTLTCDAAAAPTTCAANTCLGYVPPVLGTCSLTVATTCMTTAGCPIGETCVGAVAAVPGACTVSGLACDPVNVCAAQTCNAVAVAADLYEIQYAKSKGFQGLANLGIFPKPAIPVPDGKQWTGIVNPANGTPLLTEVWGYGQLNQGGGPLGGAVTWPAMTISATRGKTVQLKWVNNTPDQHLTCPYPQAWDWPCAIDRSVDLPGQFMGFMGTQWMSKSRIIPPNAPKVCAKGMGQANQPQSGLSCTSTAQCPVGETCTAEAVTPWGSVMQPDNAVVPHFHGGNIPPGSDGFAEKMFGNAITSAWYNPGVAWASGTNTRHPCDANCAIKAGFTGSYCVGNAASCKAVDENGDTIGWPLDPGFAVGTNVAPLFRPLGNSVTYHYPLFQEPATIWYHDHALGKTRINVIAGPAGYFPVSDAAHPAQVALSALGLHDPTGLSCYNNLAPFARTPGDCRDRFVALQDRAFNNDGSINYPNGMGQPPIPPIQPGNINNAAGGTVTPALNPSITPQWVPEYFGDMAVVNGVIWPKATVYPAVYRLRLLEGSNARCYTLGLMAGKNTGVPFYVIADEQGYLDSPQMVNALTMCPGERYEALVDFRGMLPNTVVVMTNTAGAPFPAGITPQQNKSPFAAMAQIMTFNVVAPPAGWVDKAALAPVPLSKMILDAGFAAKSYTQLNKNGVAMGKIKACLPSPILPNVCGTLVPNQWHYLNEVLNPVTLAPEKIHIDGVAFEDALLQTQPKDKFQVWEIVNTTVDAHPMHLHLVKFQIVNRQAVDTKKYKAAVTALGQLNPTLPAVDPTPFLLGQATPPLPEEKGFKDTAISNPGEVLRIIAWWGGEYPQWPAGATAVDNVSTFAPVTNGPYVWHCHIVDHEDREMMRPTLVQ